MAGGMEIVREQRTNEVVLKISGRLDGYWANHLAEAVHDVLREGVHDLRLDLSQTFYVSSGGIRILVDAYKEFVGVGGSFAIVYPSPGVKQVIELSGLGPLLLGGSAPVTTATAEAQAERIEIDGCVFETYSHDPSASLACRSAGRPQLLPQAGFGEPECEVLTLPKDVFALGLGALGEGFAACRDRFGEFLAVAGNAACQPTDGTNYPDYLMASGTLVPKVTALYSIACRGGFRKLMRFECPPEGVPVPFSAVLAQARRQFPGTTVGLTMVAESAGLLGAALKRPPVAASVGAQRVFEHPEVRRWLSFSPERSYTRSVAVIAGVVSDDPPPQLAPLLRPISPGGTVKGHFHAGAFGYHPLQKGRVELHATITKLFDTGGLHGVMHLLADDRPSGGGESVLLRGACWFGPIDHFVSQEETL
ncbi:MAG: STAS domain-containing protein [Terriglobia bacterium]